MAKLNTKIILSNLNEAAEELEDLKGKMESGDIDELELQIALQHAYHHLNFAWNIRHVPTEKYANLNDEEFKKWGSYPTDIDEDYQ